MLYILYWAVDGGPRHFSKCQFNIEISVDHSQHKQPLYMLHKNKVTINI